MDKQLIHEKISEVMSAVEAIGKDRANVQQGYKFRGIDDMYNALNEHLAKAKIYFTSDILFREREERVTAKGGNIIYTILTIKWTVRAEDGSSVETTTVGEAMDSGDKSANKAMSAAYKYALMQLFCIPTEDEKDTEAQTHEVTAKTQPSPVKQATGGAEKVCILCNKAFTPDPKYPYSKTCSYICGAEVKKQKAAALAANPDEETPF